MTWNQTTPNYLATNADFLEKKEQYIVIAKPVNLNFHAFSLSSSVFDR